MKKVDAKFVEYEKIVNSAIAQYGQNVRAVQQIGTPENRPYKTEGTKEWAIYTAYGILVGHLRGFAPIEHDKMEKLLSLIEA